MAETIGQQLRRAREARNLSLEKVVQATHIRAHNLELLEADDFESLPSPVQARAFLKIYAEYLELRVEDLIAHQREQMETAAGSPVEPVSSQPVAEEDQPEEPEAETLPAPEPATDAVSDKPATRRFIFPSLFKRERAATPADEPSAEPQDAATPAGPAPEESTAPPADTRSSQSIFTQIGQELLSRRESLSLTLDEIERHTHVRKHYLQALEAGEFGKLPSSVQTRGMLNNYAHFLDLDVEEILLQFAEGLQVQRLERQPKVEAAEVKPAAKRLALPHLPPALQRYLTVDVIVGGGLILLLLVFSIWGANRIISLRAAVTLEPTIPSISNFLGSAPEAGSPTASPTAASGSGVNVPLANDTQVVTLPTAGPGVVQVLVVAQRSAWVRVSVDGKVAFVGRIDPGSATAYSANSQIEVLTGNGAAVNIIYNQSDLGAMGAVGEVVDRIYTANAILSPTATFTPTPTITPIPSRTLRPTSTRPFTSTPRPSATPRP